MKKAVIYVRVAEEWQRGDYCDARIQKDQCMAHCKSKNYEVVSIYRDIMNYLVDGVLVDPSGLRADRPGFQEMIQDGYKGIFDVIVSWQEDRLYRSSRPMIDVIELIEKKSITIDSVKEVFDKNTAPLRAWVAGWEFHTYQDRNLVNRAKERHKATNPDS